MINIGILADWHAGSMYGLWPEGFKGSAGVHVLNVGQCYLLENWLRIAKAVPRLDILILNGDEIDGQQPKDEARYLGEVDPKCQAGAALELLEPWRKRVAKGGEIYATEGTRYHVGIGATWSEFIAEKMGAVPMRENKYAWDWLLLDVAGKRLDVAHRQSVTMAYRSMPGERELNWSELHSDKADLVVRSHAHYYDWLEFAREDRVQCYLSTPAWQLQNHFCRTSVSPNRKDGTMLGMVVVTISHGEIDKRRFLFEHPSLRRAEYATSEAG